MIKQIFKLMDKIDLGKKFNKYIDKRIIRTGFLFVFIIQLIAFSLNGFIFNVAWAECNYDSCSNPFFGATGELCEKIPNLCTQKTLTKGEIIGIKPPTFVLYANSLSWLCLFISGIVNYYVCKKRRLTNGKRI